MFLRFYALCLVFLTSFFISRAQPKGEDLTVMFYNVENLFDTENDPKKKDNEFTPDGVKQWDNRKYYRKLTQIYKVIIAAGGWNPPVIVGLSEIENQQVIEDLLTKTPLKNFNYHYVHEESDDFRGIDVGLLYRKDYFQYLNHQSLNIPLKRPTRDLLLVSGMINGDTCHLIVNHWPSRMGGKIHSDELRLKASSVLKAAIDSLSEKHCNPKIIALGDFNDGPADESLLQITEEGYRGRCGDAYKMVNLFEHQEPGTGTLTYTDVFTNWFTFDQILVSKPLLLPAGLHAKESKGHIFREKWLLNKDGKPRRTYLGDFYQGGISDHLPVYFRLSWGNVD